MSLPAVVAARLPVRAAVLAAGALVLPIAAYAGYRVVRDSSAFAVHRVVVTGAPAPLAPSVRAAAVQAVHGRSLLAVAPGSVARALDALPAVQSASVDRDFPSTLRIRVVPERPVAVAISGRAWVVVAADGRVLQTTDRAHQPSLPHVLYEGAVPAPGAVLQARGARAALAAVVALPPHFAGRIASVRSDTRGSVVARLEAGVDIRLGPVDDARTKLRVASLVLAQYPRPARSSLRYVDVSSPAHPAVCPRTPNIATLGVTAAADGTTTTPTPHPDGAACLVAPASGTTSTGSPSSTTATATAPTDTTTTSTTP